MNHLTKSTHWELPPEIIACAEAKIRGKEARRDERQHSASGAQSGLVQSPAVDDDEAKPSAPHAAAQ